MTITTLLKRLWHHISSRRRSQFAILLILMVAASFAEILSIGAVLPFLAVLTAPEKIINHPTTQSLIHTFGYTTIPTSLNPLHSALSTQHYLSSALKTYSLSSQSHSPQLRYSAAPCASYSYGPAPASPSQPAPTSASTSTVAPSTNLTPSTSLATAAKLSAASQTKPTESSTAP